MILHDPWSFFHLSFRARIYVNHFFDAVRNQTSNKVTRVKQKNIRKVHEITYVT